MIDREKVIEFVWKHCKLLTEKKDTSSLASGINYGEIDYDYQHPLYGSCHKVSAWVMWMLNGEDGPQGRYQLYQERMEGVIGYHTYLIDTETDEILDFTADQLPEGWEYEPERKGSTITKYSKWGKRYATQVPSNLTFRLTKMWMDEGNGPMSMDWWLNEELINDR